MKERRFIQYNMWKNCRNHCEFCFNRGYKTSDTKDKIRILDFVNEKLVDTETDAYNEIGFIGGEFFDNQLDDPTVKDKFYHMFETCADRIEKGQVDKVYVATSLIFDPHKHLLPFVEFIKKLGIENNTLFCTSYDVRYRFHTPEDLKIWEDNMKLLRSVLSKPIHTEIIVTQAFLDAVNSGLFSIPDFVKKYDTYVDYIEPTASEFYETRQEFVDALPDFFPRREDFIKFIQEYGIEKHQISVESFMSVKLRSDTSYYDLNGRWIKMDNRWTTNVRRVDKNGNVKPVDSYVDSKAKMLEDVESFLGSV